MQFVRGPNPASGIPISTRKWGPC